MSTQFRMRVACGQEGCDAVEEYWGELKSSLFMAFGGADIPEATLPEGWETLREYNLKDGIPDEFKRTYVVCPSCFEEARKKPAWEAGKKAGL